MKRAIVTGGAGFIGSHLTERLLAEGWEVHVVDDFSNGRAANLAHLSDGNLSVHRRDINSLRAGVAPFDRPSTVFHLAALADIVPSIERPLDYFQANVAGTSKVLEAARGSSATRMVYAASSSCYGIPDAYPTTETAHARPEYPYALTKYMGEEMVRHWATAYGLSTISLRLFNVYGPRARTNGTYGAVFGVFLAQKLANHPFTVVGDGTQCRDFTYVSDVVDAFVLAGKSKATGCYNVGTGNPVSVNRIVELLGGARTALPKRPGEPDRTHADIAEITRVLGWKPRVSIEEGVEKMLEHIDYWREAPVWTPAAIEKATASWFAHLGRGATT
jgi:UDP-glucose 4-epimerase